MMFAVAALHAQCSVSITSIAINGLTVSFNASGTGATTSAYTWISGDPNIPVPFYNAQGSFTYTAAGTYSLCVTYSDAANPTNINCIIPACTTVTVAPVGIAEADQLQASLTVFPSPFSTTTAINYSLSQSTDIEVQVYDVTGKLVTTLLNRRQEAGTHTINWDAVNIEAGIYFVRLKTENGIVTRRIAKQ